LYELTVSGDDPPRDRTSELRKKGFEGRRLGPKQMTTDTAVRVTRLVVEEKSKARYIQGRQLLMDLQPHSKIFHTLITPSFVSIRTKVPRCLFVM
jgi:ribosome biogenesis SPOUT family RNA methylase Rps3